jgi:hypothetical protein
MLRQYYLSCDSYSANRWRQRMEINLRKLFIGATNSSHFAY